MPAQTSIKPATQAVSESKAFVRSARGGVLSGTSSALGTLSFMTLLATAFGGLVRFSGNILPGKAKAVTSKVADGMQLHDKALADLPEAAGAVFGSNTVVPAAVGKIGDYANKTLGQNITGRLADKSPSQLITAASIGLGGGLGLVSGFRGKIKTLQMMNYDLTGEKPSAFAIISGSKSLHPMVNAARKELMGSKAGIAAALDVGGIAFSLYSMFARNQPKIMQNMFVQVGVGMGLYHASNVLTSGQTTLASYLEAHRAYAEGQPISDGVRAGIIGGLLKNAREDAVYALAREYRDLSPAEMLRNIADLNKENAPQVMGAATARIAAQRAAATKTPPQFALGAA